MKHKKFTLDTFLELTQSTNRVPPHLSPDGSMLAMSVQPHKRASGPGGDQSYTARGVPNEMVGSRVLVIDTITGAVEEPFPDGSTMVASWWDDTCRLYTI